MIVANKQASQQVNEPRVKNFYPKNLPRTSQSSSSMFTASQDNFFRTTSSFKKSNAGAFFSPKQSTQNSQWQQSSSHDLSQKWEEQQMSKSQQFPQYSITSNQSQTLGRYQDGGKQLLHSTSLGGQYFQDQSQQLTGQFRDKLNDQRKQRQQMENSVEALKNRVNLLQMEEQRTVQKMVDTQKKTIEIISNKTGHMQAIANKNDEKLSRTEQIVKRQLELKQMREEKKERDDLMKKMRASSASMQVQRIKHLKNQYANHQQMMEQEMLMRKTHCYQLVKQSEREQEIKKMTLQDQRRQQAHQTYTSKCKTEISKKAQSEIFIGELEKKEQELVKKLQFSQNLQSSALIEMQRASQIPSNLLAPKSANIFSAGNDPHTYFITSNKLK